ncbi:hypothetical protein BY996DRAFT_6415847 [Phakopsora pachyrhizi]|nr:hypothetical protein BY996DRAFT_6415847 [Phakopsora pachyrhizi]
MKNFKQLNWIILGLLISLSYEIRSSVTQNIYETEINVLRARQAGPPTIDTSTLRECKNMKIVGGGGFNGRKASDFTFRPEDSKIFKQKEAQNLGIICNAMCNDLKNVCKFKDKDEVVVNCNKIKNFIGTTKDKGKMDLWNSLFGGPLKIYNNNGDEHDNEKSSNSNRNINADWNNLDA